MCTYSAVQLSCAFFSSASSAVLLLSTLSACMEQCENTLNNVGLPCWGVSQALTTCTLYYQQFQPACIVATGSSNYYARTCFQCKLPSMSSATFLLPASRHYLISFLLLFFLFPLCFKCFYCSSPHPRVIILFRCLHSAKQHAACSFVSGLGGAYQLTTVNFITTIAIINN